MYIKPHTLHLPLNFKITAKFFSGNKRHQTLNHLKLRVKKNFCYLKEKIKIKIKKA